MSKKTENDETILANAGIDSDSAQGAVIPPIYLSTNYSFDGFGGKRTFDYARPRARNWARRWRGWSAARAGW
ncbi:MAG TPA: PLP-dependent transferase [Terricaulis sp.]|nr:PLP-dependent transferase [Terricaulis sp.]